MDEGIKASLKILAFILIAFISLMIIQSITKIFIEIPIDIAEKICDKKGGEIKNEYPWSPIYCIVKYDNERISYYFVQDNEEWYLKKV